MSKKAWTLLRSAHKLLKIEQESTNFVMALAKVVPVGRACPANWVVVMLSFPQRPSLSPRAPMWSQWQGERGHILCREQGSVSAQPVVPVGMGEVLGLSKQFCCHSSGRSGKSLWGLGKKAGGHNRIPSLPQNTLLCRGRSTPAEIYCLSAGEHRLEQWG